MGGADEVTAAAGPGPRIGVTVVYSPCEGEVDEVSLRLPAGATLAEAVRASGLQQRHAGVDLAQAPVGVWGVLRGPDHVLREADRVELYRPLTVDPKEARRRRQRIQRDAVSRPR
jgi:putative ubiquitin-RnfH superfamily antitoxin RatB of RatAB toxin-antitoxin module